MYKLGETIEEILDQIQRNELVLPAIQREFVWRPNQIYRFFDSIMQGYPFGTFLYWRVLPEHSAKFNFYDFVIKYHERDSRHCPRLPMLQNKSLKAVLDGQQRLTALNIGLRGSMAIKRKHSHWNNPNAFPIRRLCLDLLWQPSGENVEEHKYRFQFLTSDQLQSNHDEVCWFPVHKILSFNDPGPAMTKWLNDRLRQDLVTQAHSTLYELYQVVRSKNLISYYEEKSQDLDKVLQIFIRLNQGGTLLSYSDLLLSVAVAQWRQHDAREEIHSFVDEINNLGGPLRFSFSKDLVLKAGLMLCGISVGFKAENFRHKNMEKFENNWEEIKKSLTLTVQLVSSFGFNRQNLRAHNAILPIAYYLHHRNFQESYLLRSEHSEDRNKIRHWFIRSLLKRGVWGSGLDTLLTSLRDVIDKNDDNGFPIAGISEAMMRQGKSLVFEEEEVELLADMEYSNGLTFALLSLIFPFIDLRNQFHVDHIYPKTKFSDKKLQIAGVPDDKIEEFIQFKDRLGNLQFLEGVLNSEKGKKMPLDWLKETRPDCTARKEFLERHMLGNLQQSIVRFDEFYDERRQKIREKIKELLG